jgi:hypothetical protein
LIKTQLLALGVRVQQKFRVEILTYIVGNNEKSTVSQNAPDENVTKDSSNQIVSMRHHDGAIPVNGHKGPCQWSRGNGNVDEARSSVVAEIQRAEVQEIDHKNDLSNGKVPVCKEQDKGDVEDVVEDEVGADTGSSVDDIGTFGEEGSDVSKLEDEKYNPISSCVRRLHLVGVCYVDRRIKFTSRSQQ